MARIVLDERPVISQDLSQIDQVFNTHYTLDDTEMNDALAVVVVLAAGASYVAAVGAAGLPPGWTRIGYLRIESDAPITYRLNTVDGTTGTEIPVTPVISPALSQSTVAPSPAVTASVQRGKAEHRFGVSADSPAVSVTSVWLKNNGVTNATIKVVMAGE